MTARPAPADPARRRYQLLAPIYDWTSGERPLYAAARAIELLRLRPGATVVERDTDDRTLERFTYGDVALAAGTQRRPERARRPADAWSVPPP
jgi:hypothetical protein